MKTLVLMAQRGSIRKRKTGGTWKWLGSYRDGDHHRSPTLGLCSAMTKTDAQAALDKLVRPVNEATGAVSYSLAGFTRQVAIPFLRRSWKESSTGVTTVDRIERHILRAIGDTPLASCTRDFLQDFLDDLATQRPARGKEGEVLSHSTVLHVRWDLNQLFALAVNDGLLARNPAELLHAPRGKKREQRVLSLQQAIIILAMLGLRERLIVKLAGICGMRPGEIVALTWRDIKDQSLIVERRVYRGKIDTPKTANSNRAVALPQSVRDDLNEWRSMSRNNNPEDWVFPSEHNKTPIWANNVLYDKIRPTLKKLGLDWVTYQVLRRSAVTLMNAQGADGTVVASQCGHTVDVSTNVYNKVGLERQLAAVQALDTALATPTPLRAS